MAVLVGPQGSTGPQGRVGPVGPRGFDGKRGLTGKNGKDGERGPKGDRGDRGFPGTEGRQGIQGLRGFDGAPGKDGSIAGIEHAINPTDVSTDSTPGSGLTAAARDHTHKGVRSIHADGEPQLFGDVQLVSGAGISMAQVGNTITLSSSGTGTPLTFTAGLFNTLGTVKNTFFTGSGSGQTLFGGGIASGDLNISSTSHATKGTIFFGVGSSGMQYDETDNLLVLPSADGASASIALTMAGAQEIAKRGSGALYVGTFGAEFFGLYTNDITRLRIEATGEVRLSSLIAGGVTFAAPGTGELGLVTIGAGLDLTAGVLSATGTVSLPADEIGFGTGTGITSSTDLTYASGTLNITGGTPLVAGGGVTGTKTSFIDQDNLANFAQFLAYPASGTNVGQQLAVAPRGTGYATTLKAQIALYNTDPIADSANYEFFSMRAIGTDGFVFSTGKTGTASNRPMMFASGFGSDGITNANQLLLNTNGSVQMSSLAASGIVLADTSGVLGLTTIGAGLDLTAGVLSSTVSPTSDHKLSIDGTDTTYDYLAAKLTATVPAAVTVVGGPGPETLDVSVLYDTTSIGLDFSNQLSLVGIPDGTPLAGDLIFPAYSAPATPAAGTAAVWYDTLAGNLWIMNDAAVSSHTAQTQSAPTHEFFNGLNDDGSFSVAQPDFGDLTGSATYGQIQVETAHTLLGNPSGSLVSPSEITLAATLAFSGTTIGVAAHGVDFAHMQQVGAQHLVGNPTGSTADISEFALGVGLDFHNYGTGLTLRNSSPLSDLAVTSPLHLSGTTIGWSGLGAGQVMFTDPIGIPTTDSTFTFNTTTKILAAEALALNGIAAPTNVSFITGHTTNTDRDRVQFSVGGGTLGATGTGDDSLFSLVPSNTTVRPSVSAGIYSIARFGANSLSSAAATTITEAATIYIDGKPFIGSNVSLSAAGHTYALHAAGGLMRFDSMAGPGMVVADSIGTLTTVTHEYGTLTLGGYTANCTTSGIYFGSGHEDVSSTPIEYPIGDLTAQGAAHFTARVIVTNFLLTGSLQLAITAGGSILGHTASITGNGEYFIASTALAGNTRLGVYLNPTAVSSPNAIDVRVIITLTD